MRGFYNTRLHVLFMGDPSHINRDVVEFGAPLSDDEIAAAKREGCAGCVWSDGRLKDGYTALVCAREPQDVIVSGGRHWCSEWRQKPATDTSEGNP